MKKTLITVVAVLAFFGAYGAFKYLTRAVVTQYQVDSLSNKSTKPIASEEEAKKTFVDACDDGSYTSSTFSQHQYCQCVYDGLRQDYSINELAKMGLTKDGSTERTMQPYVKSCVAQQGLET